MSISAADPADLSAYVAVAAEEAPRLRRAAGDLADALVAFRASEGRSEFIADVPEADLDLVFLARRWSRLGEWLRGVARDFEAADTDPGSPGAVRVGDSILDASAGRFALPEVEIRREDGRLVIDTGGGDDRVTILDLGVVVVVRVGHRTYTFGIGDDDRVLVRGGAGDDEITTTGPFSARAGTELDGGTGQDVIEGGGAGETLRGGPGRDILRGAGGDDRIIGGGGNDRIEGGDGDDRILGDDGHDNIDAGSGDDFVTGGAGDDLIYGVDGADLITGGNGRDHIQGGRHDDRLVGGDGGDVVSGGEGDDVISGDEGRDVIYAGPGRDRANAGSGADRVFVERRDAVTDRGVHDEVVQRDVDLGVLDHIEVVPSGGDFAARVRADLVTLASSSAGRRLLEALRGRRVMVAENVDVGPHAVGGGYAHGTVDLDHFAFDAGFGPAAGVGKSWAPVTVLHHELVHALDDATKSTPDGVYLGPDQRHLPTVAAVTTGGPSKATERVRIDTNRDGSVSRDELDRNDDGRVDEDDLDLNDDGVVDHRDGWTSNHELRAVGLPFDSDADPATPDVAVDSVPAYAGISENDLRAEMGQPRREDYRDHDETR